MNTISNDNAITNIEYANEFNNSSWGKACFIKRWVEIQQIKTKFIQYSEDPRKFPYIRQEVASSWIRSHSCGVDVYGKILNNRLTSKEIAQILDENRLLIDFTKEIYNTLKLAEIINSSRSAFYLFEKNGILLLHEGDKLLTLDPKIGIIWSEDTLGTCAHTLSMQYKRPIHLLGVEHYCTVFTNSNVLSAPILDENGELIATLSLSQHLDKPAVSDKCIHMSSYLLGLIVAMATAIEYKLKLKESYAQLNTANNRLKIAYFTQKGTMSFLDKGIVSIDRTGKIVHVNKKATHIFQINYNEIINKNIDYFIPENTHLMNSIAKGENIDLEIDLGCDKQPYQVNIRPVWMQGEVFGAVLSLTHSEKQIEKQNPASASEDGELAGCRFEYLIGESKSFKKAIEMGRRFACSAENILLIGESGTGKELFAQAIHNKYRPQGPFMAINCAALPRELIESELFGYEGGSFTGAERSGKSGKIELAHGGTLFLDEIGDMPLELQAVLLRVLEDKQVMRIGGRRYKKIDFRLIAATNKDLCEIEGKKTFRQDLYYRLSTLSIKLPPLRERGNDVEILARYFLEKYCKTTGRKAFSISPTALEIMKEFSWPGNVRQLRSAIIYAINAAKKLIIEPEDLPPGIFNEKYPVKTNTNTDRKTEGGYTIASDAYTVTSMEKVLIENAMFKTKRNITKAAELLGIGKSTLYRKLKEYNI